MEGRGFCFRKYLGESWSDPGGEGRGEEAFKNIRTANRMDRSGAEKCTDSWRSEGCERRRMAMTRC